MRDKLTYIFLGIAFVSASALCLVLETSPYVKDGLGLVALVSLAGLVGKIFLEMLREEAQRLAKKGEQRFELGLTSHMANTCFDRHALFCQEYVEEVERISQLIHKKSPTKVELAVAANLRAIRAKHSVWLSAKQCSELIEFESFIHELAADSHYFEKVIPDDIDERRQVLRDIYDKFKMLTGRLPDDDARIVSFEACKQYLREILDIDKLISLRSGLIEDLHSQNKDS